MVSQRRIRLVALAIATLMLILIYRSTRSAAPDGAVTEFYRKTVSALEEADLRSGRRRRKFAYPPDALAPADPDLDRDGDVDADDERLARDTAKQLRAAEKDAKGSARKKAPLRPDSPSEVVGVGSSADGQVGGGEWTGTAGGEDVDDEVRVAEVELNAMLKRAPVIIFSKTWCPHSKRAKRILLESYSIDPEPLVVELDEHPYGAAIQALLADKTHHATVPNVLVSGVSIGGGDDVAALDAGGKLGETLEELGGGRVVVVVGK